MANDNLSGVILTSYLAKFIKSIKNRYWSYRIVFLPETIGAISYCKINENKMKQIDLGLVVTNVGGKGDFSYKQSYESDHFINKIVNELFKELKLKIKNILLILTVVMRDNTLLNFWNKYLFSF